MNSSLIELKNITKTYISGEREQRVLKKINLSIQSGEYISICGPSGCGKSSLLNIIGLLDTPSSGEYFIDGIEVSAANKKKKAALRNGIFGFVFQSFNLIDDYSVLKTVELPLKYKSEKVADKKEVATDRLQKVGLIQYADYFPSQLSGGEQQRVAVARALAADTRVLLVDEPTGNLDSANGDQVMALLKELNQSGVTIILVTHDKRYADMANRVVNLLDGEVI